MNNFEFSCPIDGCMVTLSSPANVEEEAIDDLSRQAKVHLMNMHPEITKNDEQVKSDISSLMERVNPESN